MAEADLELACRLANASDLAYSIGKVCDITQAPGYDGARFESAPLTYQAGKDDIDACLLGRTIDGVVLAFRGTLPLPPFDDGLGPFFKAVLDWLNDGDADQVRAFGGRVHDGFHGSLENLTAKFEDDLVELTRDGSKLLITGHSKGGAVAFLAGAWAAEKVVKPDTVVTFAAARAGDDEFAKAYEENVGNTWRYENRDDIVPHLPPDSKFMDWLEDAIPDLDLPSIFDYESVGTLQFIDWSGDIVGESRFLEMKRTFSLFKKLLHFEFEEVIHDHSLTDYYLKAVCPG